MGGVITPSMTAINPKASWVTDQQLNPWDEPTHYVLSGDLTTAEPVAEEEDDEGGDEE